MSLTVTINDLRLITALAAANKAAGDPQVSDDEYFSARVNDMLEGWAAAYSIGVVPVFGFVKRFTPEEFKAIRGSADPVVQGLLARLDQVSEVHLYVPEVANGLQYLASVGLLTAKRAAEIGAIV